MVPRKDSEVANTLYGMDHHIQGNSFGADIFLHESYQGCAHLNKFVPTTADNDWVLRVWAEAHTRYPLRMALVSDGVFAVAEGVPQLDGTVAGSRNDLTVIGGEGDGEDVVVVANKATSGVSGGEFPETESLVP